MIHQIRLHYRPRTATLESDTPDILVPALAELRRCRDPVDVIRLCGESIPPSLLAPLAWEAFRKSFVPRWAVHTVVKFIVRCGNDGMLQRGIGHRRAAQLLARFPINEPVRSLDASAFC